MEDKKVCKQIIKRAKKHPDWYTPEEVSYAKMMKKAIKKETGDTRCLTSVKQHNMIGKTFGTPLKSLEHGIALTLRKCGRNGSNRTINSYYTIPKRILNP